MNNESLKYLREMEKEKEKRPFSNDEIEKLHESLRQNVGANDSDEALDNVGANDSDEALDIAAKISETQVDNYGTNVDSLLDTIIYHADLKGNKDAQIIATDTKLSLAAKFIDSEQYDKFENMNFKNLNNNILEYCGPIQGLDIEGTPPYLSEIYHRVKTTKGALYLENNNFIPRKLNNPRAIEYASEDQLEHYIKNGADINAVLSFWVYGDHDKQDRTLLDTALMSPSYSLSHMKKIIELGGVKKDRNYLCEALDHAPNSSFSYFIDENDYKLFLSKVALLCEAGLLEHHEHIAIKENCSTTDCYSIFSKAKNIDFLQIKADMVRSKIWKRAGKTGDSSTGKVTSEHQDIAQQQTDISKHIMLLKKERDDK